METDWYSSVLWTIFETDQWLPMLQIYAHSLWFSKHWSLSVFFYIWIDWIFNSLVHWNVTVIVLNVFLEIDIIIHVIKIHYNMLHGILLSMSDALFHLMSINDAVWCH